MQIPTLVRRFILIFLRFLFACELSFTFCEFDTVAFLIVSTVVTHRMLTLISQAILQWWHHSVILQSHDNAIMMNVMWWHFDQSAKQLIVDHYIASKRLTVAKLSSTTAAVERAATVDWARPHRHWPLVFEDVEAYCPSHWADVGMPDPRHKLHLPVHIAIQAFPQPTAQLLNSVR